MALAGSFLACLAVTSWDYALRKNHLVDPAGLPNWVVSFFWSHHDNIAIVILSQLFPPGISQSVECLKMVQGFFTDNTKIQSVKRASSHFCIKLTAGMHNLLPVIVTSWLNASKRSLSAKQMVASPNITVIWKLHGLTSYKHFCSISQVSLDWHKLFVMLAVWPPSPGDAHWRLHACPCTARPSNILNKVSSYWPSHQYKYCLCHD